MNRKSSQSRDRLSAASSRRARGVALAIGAAAGVMMPAPEVRAGDVFDVGITATESVPGNGLIVYVSATHVSPPCGQGQTSRYAISGTEKAMVAQALLAHATGRRIDITGKGVCDAWTDTETILYLLVR